MNTTPEDGRAAMASECLRRERVGRPDEFHSGGTVTYRVTVAGRWVGWVGDGRAWRGWRYGRRQWWACWREHGDTAARWSTGLAYPTRKAALAALLTHVN